MPAKKAWARKMTEVRRIEKQLYFAYGSNMNLDQMAYRCPDATVVENVRLEGYRLAFCGGEGRNGVATILPEAGSCVDGVLWSITPRCERSLDWYEGYPHLYGKETVCVQNAEGVQRSVAAYVMNAPYKDCPSVPSPLYLKGILEGCEQNGIRKEPVMEAARQTKTAEKARGRNSRKKYMER